MCKRILDGIKIVDLNTSVIIFDTCKTDELKTTIRRVVERLKSPAVSYSHCLDGHECDNPDESDDAENNYYVSVSKWIQDIFHVGIVRGCTSIPTTETALLHNKKKLMTMNFTQIVSPSHVILNIVRTMVRAFEMENISIFYEPSISKSNNWMNNFMVDLLLPLVLLILIFVLYCPFYSTRLHQ